MNAPSQSWQGEPTRAFSFDGSLIDALTSVGGMSAAFDDMIEASIRRDDAAYQAARARFNSHRTPAAVDRTPFRDGTTETTASTAAVVSTGGEDHE